MRATNRQGMKAPKSNRRERKEHKEMKTLELFTRQHVVPPSGGPARRVDLGRVELARAARLPGASPVKTETACGSFSAFFAFFAVKFSAPFLAVLFCVSAAAFPPAPHHLLFGTIRDEMGNPLVVPGAEVILETQSGTSIKAAIMPGLEPGVNYKLSVPLDTGVTSDIYRPNALRAALPFKLRVRIGQTVYLPIEMAGEFSKLGHPAQSTRLDLTLGEDSNGNGLPDAWERALIAASGGKLRDVRPADDADGDGLTNLQEYQAGTYAFDSKDGFSVKVVEMKASEPTLEFMAIRGHTYTVFGSQDLKAWAQAPFRFASDSPEAADRQNYLAPDSQVVRISVRPSTGQSAMRFFKLRVE